ncbi:signal recognition particle 19 kDa protein-like [Branchiostoma lanceolatum]|uniref:Signal recognition particle 19 kDa protein n=1 Tax=Branchiostoma lanceolatum TaxID=7740 RepID=A0A8K0EII2_BRALA|nr:Hypp9251 [Branchiostoma lanceolatum]
MALDQKPYSDKDRFICIYPAYINSRRTLPQGRRIPQEKGVDNPTATEIKDVLQAGGFNIVLENKAYAKELFHRDPNLRGRIRVQLKNDDGSPINEKFPNRKSVYLYVAETIPKLKTRVHASGGASSQQGGDKGKKGKKKGKR